MEERELAIWKGIRDALCEPIENKRLWKLECMKCDSTTILKIQVAFSTNVN